MENQTAVNTISLPDNLEGKTGTVISFIVILILIWLSNTGRLIPLIGLFQQAGANIKNGITSGTGNINTSGVNTGAVGSIIAGLQPITIGNAGSNAPVVIGNTTVNGANVPVTTPLPSNTISPLPAPPIGWGNTNITPVPISQSPVL